MKTKLLLVFILFSISYTIRSQGWSEISSPTNVTINSCCFINENLGWIVSSNGIYKTTDGGSSWISQSYPDTPANNYRFFNSIHFIDANTGIIACGNYLYSGHDPSLVSTILWTNDGGITWTYKDLGSFNDYDRSAILVSPLIAYSIGQYGLSKKTVDGGVSWTPCSFSSNTGYSGIDLYAFDQNNIYFAGLQNIFLSAAIGKMNTNTWVITDFPGYVEMQTIFFATASIGWTAGNGGVVKITTNGGATWTDGNSGTTDNIDDISFKDSTHGWAVTNTGKILKTIDGGFTWSVDFTGTGALYKVAFKNLNGFGYAVGNGGKIYKYTSDVNPNPGDGQCWQKIEDGYAHTLSIKSDGSLWAWGYNLFGGLGDGSTTMRNAPTQVGTGTDWQSVAGGNEFSVGIKTDGTLWTWGWNALGQLGNGTFTNQSIPLELGTATNWKSIAVGYGHVLALKTDGTLWSWGFNNHGQLGTGDTSIRAIPTQIGTDTNWQSLGGALYNTFAIKSDGTLWDCGYNGAGQLGDGTNTDKFVLTQIGTDTNWKSIAGGDTHTAAIKTDGTFWAWGNNPYGQLGDGSTNYTSAPIQIGTATDWQDVATKGNSTIGLKTDNSLFTWGYNGYGELGDGTTSDRHLPTQINCSTLGTPDNTIPQESLVVYPNPVKDIVHFTVDNEIIKQVDVYDSCGKLIYSTLPYEKTITVSGLASGIYFLKVYTDTTIFNAKIVKE